MHPAPPPGRSGRRSVQRPPPVRPVRRRPSRPSRIAARSRGPPRPRVRATARAPDRGHAPQSVTRIAARAPSSSTKQGHRVQPAVDRRRVGQRRAEPLAASRRAPAPVTVRSIALKQAALALAGQRRASSRLRRVAWSISIMRRRADRAGRRRQRGKLAHLGQLDIVDQRAGGGEFGPAEHAERVQRLDPNSSFRRAFAVRRRNSTVRQRRQHVAPPLSASRTAPSASISRLSGNSSSRGDAGQSRGKRLGRRTPARETRRSTCRARRAPAFSPPPGQRPPPGSCGGGRPAAACPR